MDTNPLNPNGLLRLSQIIGARGLIPISRSRWYYGIQSGEFPKPIKLGSRAVAWRASDIALLIEKGVGNDR